MADSINGINNSSSQIKSNYEKYKDYFAKEDTSTLGQDAFLKLMVEQMKNQDFLSPTDNSEYIAQMAQFTSVQMMQELSYYSNATYATSLVGKNVTVASTNTAGSLFKETGIVSAVRMNGKEFEIVVNGKSYTTSNIMEVNAGKESVT